MPALYDLTTHGYEELAAAGAGAQWLVDGRHVVAIRDGSMRIQAIDVSTKAARDLAVVETPSTLSFGVSPDGGWLFYLVLQPEADIFRMTLPR